MKLNTGSGSSHCIFRANTNAVFFSIKQVADIVSCIT